MALPKFAAVPHGRFTIEVPDGWADDSTLSFTAPIKRGLAAPLSPKQGPQYQSNVHITVELLPDGIDSPSHFLQLIGENLKQAGAELEDVRPPEAFPFAGTEGAIVERRVSLNNEPVRQLTVVAFIGKNEDAPTNLIMGTASTSEAEADRELPLLREMLKRVRYAR